MIPAARLDHVSAGANRVTGALHWGGPGLLALGAAAAVGVADPAAGRLAATLPGHAGPVTCVRWFLREELGEADGDAAGGAPWLLASGAADGAVRLWVWGGAGERGAGGERGAAAAGGGVAATCRLWAPGGALAPAHATPATSLAALRAGGATLLAATSGDAETLVWEGPAGARGAAAAGDAAAWRLAQRLPAGAARIRTCAALAAPPGAPPGWALLALGAVDGGVELFARPPGGAFAPAARLGGHEDWVRGVAWAVDERRRGGAEGAAAPPPRLLLATASQDRAVRVFSVGREAAGGAGGGGGAAAAGAPSSLTRYAPRPAFAAGGGRWAAALEALLLGHEDWVHSVAWRPRRRRGAGQSDAPCLLSASMDRSMMLWQPEPETGLWLSRECVGDAGPNHLGYFTGVWSPAGDAIAAHGPTGALHVWTRAPSGGGWAPRAAPGGHVGAVVDVDWAADGGCLLSVSADQTARLLARPARAAGWAELARPQVHGHDFAGAAALPRPAPPGGGPRQFLYASASEEKVLRVFEAPAAFHATLAAARAGWAAAPAAGRAQALPGSAAPAGGLALGAALQALGLSNTAVYAAAPAAAAAAAPGAGGLAEAADVAPPAAPAAVAAGPPLEEHLAGSTLWPEVRKLYGHGSEVYCLAAHPSGLWLASAARAAAAPAAAVRLWDCERWAAAPGPPLEAHALTVTQLEFSPDGALLASCSRDRSVAVYRRRARADADGGAPFEVAGRSLKAHARVVWGLSWAPGSARVLATAGRDAALKLWRVDAAACGGGGDPLAPLACVQLPSGVRSVAFAPVELGGAGGDGDSGGGDYLLAVGLEDGGIRLLRVAAAAGGGGGGCEVRPLWQTDVHDEHAGAVRRLRWRLLGPEERAEWAACGGGGGGGGGSAPDLHLASCGDDHAVRIFCVWSRAGGG